MPIRRFAAALLLSIGGIGPAWAAQTCALKQIASIPATLSAGNKLMIDVTINDVPAKMAIDTGAAASALSSSFAHRIGLPIASMASAFYGLTGKALDEKTRIRELRVGNSVSNNADFTLMPIGGDGTDNNMVGLFGADYLQNYEVEIDVAGGKVNLFSQDHCPGQLVYWSPDYFKRTIYYRGDSMLHNPMIDVTVEGKPLRALIDTGAFMTVMRLAVAQDRFGLSPDTPDMKQVGESSGVDGKKLATYVHSFQSLTFGDITLHNTPIAISPIDSGARVVDIGSHLSRFSAEQPDMLIGMSLLKQLRLMIAYGENAIYYTIAAPKQAATQ